VIFFFNHRRNVRRKFEKIFESLLEDIYSDFKSKVVRGRNNPDLNEEVVDKVSQGRVWLGITARNLKLIDHLGGFVTALNVTREILGLKEDAPLCVVEYPKPPSWYQLLSHKKSSQDDNQSSSTMPSSILSSIGANILQSMFFGTICRFLGVNFSYNPLYYHSTMSNSQINLLSPVLSLDFLESKD